MSNIKHLVVAGDPIEHSLSPQMHNAALKEAGLTDQYTYSRMRTKKSEVDILIDKIRTGALWGANITVPLKQEIFSKVDRLDEDCQAIGAVNTIVRNEEEIYGKNTDIIGFTKSMKTIISRFDELNVQVLGAGGAALAVCYALLMGGAIVEVYNRTPKNAKRLIQKLNKFGQIKVTKQLNLKNIDILINCTSVGLQSNSLPIKPDLLHSDLTVIDLNYNPKETSLLHEAKRIGCLTLNGIDMLVYQGAESFKIFTGQYPDLKVMKNVVIEHLG